MPKHDNEAIKNYRERLAMSSNGSLHDIEAVARSWDSSCIVATVAARPGTIEIASKTPLSDEAREHIRIASPVTMAIEYHQTLVGKPADPWVKVGTTTIDGTMAHVGKSLDFVDACDHDVESMIDMWVRSGDPIEVGGRWFRLMGSHINSHAGTALVRCDIVRRLSECCVYCDRDHLTDAQRERAPECSACSASIAAKMSQRPDVKAIAEKHVLRYREQACPECGPHGNVGRVLLLESWVDCGTCKPDASAVVFDEEVEAQRARDQGAAVARAAIGLRGARELAALRSSLTEATVDNLRRYEALMADFKAAITIPNAPPSGYPTHDEYVNYLSARTGPATSPHAAPERPVG